MSLRNRLMGLYFDRLYNPVYDLTTACLSPYHRLQDSCVNKLGFADNDRVLCVGVGTGNEIVRILSRNDHVNIVGVDVSPMALRRAGSKATQRGQAIELYRMDAHELSFPDKTFDKALCLHVMGFLADDRRSTAEIMRVLKNGAQFVITYPSGNGLLKLGGEVGRGLRQKLRLGRWKETAKELAALIGAGVVNVPVSLWLKPGQGFYSRQQLEVMLSSFQLGRCQIEEDKIYQEFVVSGTKKEGEEFHAL